MAHAVPATSQNPPQRGGVKRVLPLLLVAALLGAGFISTYQGYWAPLSLLKPHEATAKAEPVPQVQFVALPQIALTLSGPQFRTLVMSVQIETDATHRDEVQHLLPRLSDACNSFLAGIEPAAFERRGILDIIRDELATRAVYVLGREAFSDILITEFRIQ
ncbi:flagellar basal body-associated FliL family protein [Paracoccus sp. CPCC 101403]|uniref:Flagellar protein FliL n=1 Tax=Paracoccus broussonetiae TaxID=3075834 RepID=A0ABU3EFY1_9RHOB|nr:flagellar basal body-associated FliL family protein [Paracoccus sp. CPCC 101403]MDT1063148.1 flagellar basal body-associated FliL family protein [Paracoccus sp. CPCC 101403]